MKLTSKKSAAAVLAVGALIASTVTATAASVSAAGFDTAYTQMKALKSIAAAGKGSIAVILPDTKSSARYTEFDAPYLTAAFKAAGVTKFTVQNAQGSDTTFFTDAQAAIAKGAKVLVIDPIDSTTGATVEGYAKGRGVSVIDYDRLTLGGVRSYYVSFDNVQVGKTIGQGELDCQKAWGVTNPVTYISYGSPTDNNATLFAKGYNSVLSAAGFNTSATTLSGAKQTVLENAGTWDGPTAANDFEAAYAANPTINSAVTPNDNNAAGIITYLQGKGLTPKTFPFTGQDASLVGFQNIISGYQCGTVYKPIWKEAQAAAALAIYLNAGQKAPAALLNGVTADTQEKVNVPSVLLTPSWVTADKIEATVVADKVIIPSQLCTSTAPTVAGSTQPTFADDCKTYGIK